ncbi:MAG: saccharopine dehydrogenase family protein [Cytophagaceae bacterium]
MKHILLFGSGKSSSVLIEYLLRLCTSGEYALTIADGKLSEFVHSLKEKHNFLNLAEINVMNEKDREQCVSQSDLVISLLPPHLHLLIARDCVKHKKNFITASYVSDEINALHKSAVENNTIILMESGLDPGIDHMSAMAEIDMIKNEGGEMLSFHSYTGGLIAPESDNNPWNYKITWNPKNIVLAGLGTVKYRKDGAYKYIPYHKLFQRTDRVPVNGYGDFEAYANRDSLKYLNTYGLENIPTFIRGTLRRPGFGKAWDKLVQLGMTDDQVKLAGSEELSFRKYTESFLPPESGEVEERFCSYLAISSQSEEFKKLKWLGLFEDRNPEIKDCTAATFLQALIEEKWKLEKGDLDMVVMKHYFTYRKEGAVKSFSSSMVVKGEDSIRTAMAKTVGLPVGISARLILEGKIKAKGVQIPVTRELYEPILQELETFGVAFFREEGDKLY